MSYTPGPWKVIASKPLCVGYGFDGTGKRQGDVCAKVYNEADARLIAAAPAMLEALKLIDISTFMIAGEKYQQMAFRMVKQAIAQAEGRPTNARGER